MSTLKIVEGTNLMSLGNASVPPANIRNHLEASIACVLAQAYRGAKERVG